MRTGQDNRARRKLEEIGLTYHFLLYFVIVEIETPTLLRMTFLIHLNLLFYLLPTLCISPNCNNFYFCLTLLGFVNMIFRFLGYKL